MSERSQHNFWSQRSEVTLQLNTGTIVMGVFLKNHKSEQLPFLFDFQEKGDKRFPKSTEQYFKQPFFPYSISIFRVSSRPSHFEQNN